ncbi:MAG TPA: hypothetical protein VFP54_05830 [Acidimicrobiales bacterium]|nr:hypothetical protein [Acidimicrobiales bacterium]
MSAGRWLRPIRWFLGVSAVVAALQLVPYATWQGPAPAWAVYGCLAASVLWLSLPWAVSLVGRRAVITVADLGGRSAAAGLLTVACRAQERFNVAAALLGEPQRWVRDAGVRISETTWLIAVRAREMSALESALRRARAAPDGPLRQAEERRLLDEIGAQEEAARDVAAELVRLADVAERTALTMSHFGAPPPPQLTDHERASVAALEWFRVRLESVEEAWIELQDPNGSSGFANGNHKESTDKYF